MARGKSWAKAAAYNAKCDEEEKEKEATVNQSPPPGQSKRELG
jgi:hypothetical protein